MGDGTGVPTATLAEVDILTELRSRPAGPPNYEREHVAVDLLTAEMADHPHNLLQKLTEVAVDLCDADTAGISLLDGDVIRWHAVAGVLASARSRSIPRNQSPCGVCIERDATQLMHLADRCFPGLLATPRFVETLLIPFHSHGVPIGTVWIVSHSLERKFDQEDERSLGVLAKFASAAWQLWQASETTAAHSRRKDDFLATLGHELRNPLAAIAAATGILELRTHQPSIARAVAVIVRQNRHMARLIDDLLDVARIGGGKLQLERATVDLCTIVSQTLETRRAQIERRRQTLTVDLCPEQVWLDADPVRVSQIVSNLVDNASKYTPEGGRIFVAMSAERESAIIEVCDTGLGIPAEVADSVFRPFVQLHGSKAAVGGLGLGLALVRSLTELHGGTVSVASAGPGEGSCFTVRLPIRPASIP